MEKFPKKSLDNPAWDFLFQNENLNLTQSNHMVHYYLSRYKRHDIHTNFHKLTEKRMHSIQYSSITNKMSTFMFFNVEDTVEVKDNENENDITPLCIIFSRLNIIDKFPVKLFKKKERKGEFMTLPRHDSSFKN